MEDMTYPLIEKNIPITKKHKRQRFVQSPKWISFLKFLDIGDSFVTSIPIDRMYRLAYDLNIGLTARYENTCKYRYWRIK